MFIEYFGFPASGKSSAAGQLNIELRNVKQTTVLYSHGRCITGDDSLEYRECLCQVDNRRETQFFDKINLFFMMFSTIMTGPVDSVNKLRFIKRLIVLFSALKKSKERIIICDEGFVQLYIAAKMPPKKCLDLDALTVDLSVIFNLISRVVTITCDADVIKERLSHRVSDHSRYKKWGVELTNICLSEYDRTIELIKRTYPHQVISIEEEKRHPGTMIQDILSARK
jgi:hypothetical protein